MGPGQLVETPIRRIEKKTDASRKNKILQRMPEKKNCRPGNLDM
jgi:hypothetical protein